MSFECKILMNEGFSTLSYLQSNTLFSPLDCTMVRKARDAFSTPNIWRMHHILITALKLQLTKPSASYPGSPVVFFFIDSLSILL